MLSGPIRANRFSLRKNPVFCESTFQKNGTAARTGRESREFQCESERRPDLRESGQVLQKYFFLFSNRFARICERLVCESLHNAQSGFFVAAREGALQKLSGFLSGICWKCVGNCLKLSLSSEIIHGNAIVPTKSWFPGTSPCSSGFRGPTIAQ